MSSTRGMALNFVTFNQDNSVLGLGKEHSTHHYKAFIHLTHHLGTSKGFSLYTTEPFSRYYQNEEGDVSIIEMLFSTSLVALILSPRLLRILNTKVSTLRRCFRLPKSKRYTDQAQRDTTICELTFPMKILAVRMNRKRLVVVLDESIYLYDISNMKLLHTIDTSPNPHGMSFRQS